MEIKYTSKQLTNRINWGFSQSNPKISKVVFEIGKIILFLSDKRIIVSPISKFPDIKRMSLNERKRCRLLAGYGLMFEKSNKIYHLSDFLGLHNANGL